MQIILSQIHKCQVKTVCQSFMHSSWLVFVLMDRCCLKVWELRNWDSCGITVFCLFTDNWTLSSYFISKSHDEYILKYFPKIEKNSSQGIYAYLWIIWHMSIDTQCVRCFFKSWCFASQYEFSTLKYGNKYKMGIEGSEVFFFKKRKN